LGFVNSQDVIGGIGLWYPIPVHNRQPLFVNQHLGIPGIDKIIFGLSGGNPLLPEQSRNYFAMLVWFRIGKLTLKIIFDPLADMDLSSEADSLVNMTVSIFEYSLQKTLFYYPEPISLIIV
jgi:hypothetical protein